MATYKSSKRTDFLSGRDVSIYLLKDGATAPTLATDTALQNLEFTRVSLSSQNQWTRAFFLGKANPTLISTGRITSSLAFDNVLRFFDASKSPTTFANSTRFYLQVGDSILLYIQGFSLSVTNQVQQIPEIGTDTIHTVPIPGAHMYRMSINRLISVNSNAAKTLLFELSGKTFLTHESDNLISGGIDLGNISVTKIAEYVKSTKNVSLIIVHGGDADTLTTYTITNPIIDAQSISVSAGQFAMEGVSLEFETMSGSLIPASDGSSVDNSIRSNSILSKVFQLVKGNSEHGPVIPFDVIENHAKDKFAIAVLFNTNGTRTSDLSAPSGGDTYLLYHDCFLPAYTLSVSASAPEITESFNIVVGKSEEKTVSAS